MTADTTEAPAPTMTLDGTDEATQTIESLRVEMERDPASMTVEERLARAERVANVLIEANSGLLSALISTVEATDGQFQDVARIVDSHAGALTMIIRALEAPPKKDDNRIITL